MAGPWDNEKMENPLQGRCSVKSGGILSESVLCTQDPFPDYFGVKAVDKNTEGVFSQVLLTKLNLGGTPVDNSALLAPTSPPRSPGKCFCHGARAALLSRPAEEETQRPWGDAYLCWQGGDDRWTTECAWFLAA